MDKNEIEVAGAWVPDACTLPTVERPVRVAEFEELFAEEVRDVERLEPGRLRLTLTAAPSVAGRTADLMTRETSCCSFFDFTLTATAGELRLEVAVPAQHADVLDALAARAAAVGASS